ncbi:MAG TPA: ROK family transcriptional regulator [Spirochaetia bacterium]|nr:ROK family transcriptional regulator [Spirochaetia bacterium]
MSRFASASPMAGNLAIHNILELIRTNGPLTRAELCHESGYSRSTVSLSCDTLLKIGIIIEESLVHSGEVSKRTRLRINGKAGYIIGIELGATGCEIGISNLEAELIDFDSSPVDLSHGPDPVIFQINEHIDTLMKKNNVSSELLLGIGMGLPSSVDYKIGSAIYPAFMPGWHMYPIRQLLQERYRCAVFIDNEVNTMALGEYYLGKDRKYQNLLFIKAGTGIGAGIVVNGEIYRGENGFAGNIGHINVGGRTELCMCGKTGCLEAIVGGPAIAERAMHLMNSGTSPILQEIYGKEGQLTAKEVKLAADRGDSASLSLIRDSGLILGTALGKIIMFFDPSIVIIGGGLAGFGPYFLSFIREGILRQSLPWIDPELIIQESSFGDKSGVYGSIILCIDELFTSGNIYERFKKSAQL